MERNFFGGESLTDIAADLGVTLSRVSQMRARALTLLHAAMSEVWEGRAVPADGGVRARNQQRSYVERVAGRDEYRLKLGALHTLVASLGLSPERKTLTREIERESSNFTRGVLRGLFDADGSVQGEMLVPAIRDVAPADSTNARNPAKSGQESESYMDPSVMAISSV